MAIELAKQTRKFSTSLAVAVVCAVGTVGLVQASPSAAVEPIYDESLGEINIWGSSLNSSCLERDECGGWMVVLNGGEGVTVTVTGPGGFERRLTNWDQSHVALPTRYVPGNYHIERFQHLQAEWSCSKHYKNGCIWFDESYHTTTWDVYLPGSDIFTYESTGGMAIKVRPNPKPAVNPLPAAQPCKATASNFKVASGSRRILFTTRLPKERITFKQGKLKPDFYQTKSAAGRYWAALRAKAKKGQTIKVVVSKSGCASSQYTVKVR